MHDAIRDDLGHRKRYAERDVIGVEGPSESHRRGINAELEFIRAQAEAQLEEHSSRGIHDTPQIARVFVEYVNGEPSSRCYDRGDRGDTVATVSVIGTGRYEIELAHPMPSDRYRIMDATVRHNSSADLDAALKLVATLAEYSVDVRLERIIDDRRFEISRWSQTNYGSFARASGDFAIFVFAEA